MMIAYQFPHVFYPGSNPLENAIVLKLSLDYLIAVNRAYLRRYPTLPLYKAGVVYGRTQDWLSIPQLYDQRYGDCKSLTAALIAEYRNKGVIANPVFRFFRTPDGQNCYHILVQTVGGFEDPSKVLGMGKDEVAPIPWSQTG